MHDAFKTPLYYVSFPLRFLLLTYLQVSLGFDCLLPVAPFVCRCPSFSVCNCVVAFSNLWRTYLIIGYPSQSLVDHFVVANSCLYL